MNRESRISFAEGQAFLLTGSTSKPIANFAPVDAWLYFDPTKDSNAGPTMARIKIRNQNYIREAWLDLTKKELTNQILEQISTCYAVSSSRYLLDMALLAYCQEKPQDSQAPMPLNFRQHGLCRLPNGCWLYVAGDTVLGIPPGVDYVIAPEVKLAHLARDPELSPVTATIELCKLLETSQSILFPVWGFTIVGSLRSALSGADMTTFPSLGIIGGQNLGKTTIAQRYLLLYEESQKPGSFWGQFDANSTFAAIVLQVSYFRDQIVLVDDLAKSGSPAEQRKRQDLLASILRFAANDTGRARINEKKQIEQQICKAGVAFTGEFMLQNPSDITRSVLVPIDCQMKDGRPEERTVAATVFYAFIQWLLPQLDQKLKELQQLLANVQADRNPRLAKNGLLVLWALELFFQFTEEQGAITNTYHQQASAAAEQILNQILSQQALQCERLTNKNPKGNLSWYILYGYSHNLFPVVTDQKGVNIKNCGLLKKDALYIRPSMLLQYFQERTPHSISTIKEMNKNLRREGVLGDTSEHRSAHARINGKRCLKLSFALLQKSAEAYNI